MRNCSFISALQNDGEEAVLFEGHNMIPFFWLMLLSREDVEVYRQKMIRLSEMDTNHTDTSMVLDKLTALSCAATRRDYVKKHNITCISLFDDWLYFLQISDFADMKIYVDLYNIGLSHNNMNHFCDSMLRAIIYFDEGVEAWNENSIAATCGYEGRNNNKKRFSDLSKAYRDLNQRDIYGHFDKKWHLNKKMSFSKKIWLSASILLIVIALSVSIIFFVL